MILSVDALSVTGPVRGNNEDMLSLAARMLRDSSLQVIDEESGDYWYAFVFSVVISVQVAGANS